MDVGGVSTRPGSEGINLEEELERVIPVVERIRNKCDVLVSVDTYRPEVARKAVDTGADIINDISGLSFNNGLENVVAKLGAHIVLMHLRGRPADMQEHAEYSDA